MARTALMNVMVNAVLKAGRGLARDFGEVENLQVSLKGPANFVTAVGQVPVGELAAALRAENVFVLPMPWRDSPGALRITIGLREDNDAVIAGLKRAMAAR